MWEKRWARWLLIFLGWTLLAVFFFSQTILTYLYTGSKNIETALILKLNLTEWYVWALLAPGVVWLARRFPLERHRLRRSLLVHVPACLLLAVVKFAMDTLVREHLLGVPGTPNVIFKLHPNILTYWVILGVAYAVDYLLFAFLRSA